MEGAAHQTLFDEQVIFEDGTDDEKLFQSLLRVCVLLHECALPREIIPHPPMPMAIHSQQHDLLVPGTLQSLAREQRRELLKHKAAEQIAAKSTASGTYPAHIHTPTCANSGMHTYSSETTGSANALTWFDCTLRSK